MNNQKAIIYWKNIQLDVVLPEKKWRPFETAFGKKFEMDDPEAGKRPKPIDRYWRELHSGRIHLWVSVHVSQEQEFYDFLRRFCKKHNLPVREEDLKPGHATTNPNVSSLKIE